jgi:hypothetical protein
MRKATVLTIIFVLLTLTLTHGVNAASCTVVNDCKHDVRVAYATWMEADGKYPEGYRVTGWFYIKPGKKRTFSAKYDIYVRVEGVGKQDQFHTFKPPGAAEEDSYQFSVCSTEKSFIAVETDDRTVIYNSVQRRLLSEASGFYRFAQDATFKVKEVGYALRRRESREKDARIAAANTSTYSDTAPVMAPTTVPNSQHYSDKRPSGVTTIGGLDYWSRNLPTKGGNSFIILEQFDNDCGPTSAEMVLYYYRKWFTQSDIWNKGDIYTVYAGTFPFELTQALNGLGVPAEVRNGYSRYKKNISRQG